MIRSEAAVRESGLPFTDLRPFGFIRNALRWRDQLRAGDVIVEPFADVAVAVVDPADIGAVAASALLDAGTKGAATSSAAPRRCAVRRSRAHPGRGAGARAAP